MLFRSLIDDIIVSSRLEADAAATRWDEARPPLHLEPVAIGDVVAHAVARFQTRWPGRTLVDRVGPGASHATQIDADPVILRRALDNLLDNARKYSPDDAPIHVALTTTATDVRVDVIDQGIGIDPADQPRVFSPFFRADPSRDRATGGVGLGLALARRVVEAHGGTIGFTSAPGRGSTFYFVLPAAAAPSSRSGISATT